MYVKCGMCSEKVTLRYEASESGEMPSSVICKACQDYTKGYIHPEPVMADPEIKKDQVCTDYERWTKQRTTNTKKVKVERRQYDRP